MAESEFVAWARQCLDRRIDNLPEMDAEVQTWVAAGYAAGAPMDWQFNVEAARAILSRLYPSLLG